jgi:putative OPT family oligopeptide transporter
MEKEAENSGLKPYIPQQAPVPEFTLRAILLGVLLTIVFGAANAYLGLKIGMTVSASIPAAVISMALLRSLFKDSSILENNMVQTFASAGESLIAGVIFVIPALFFLNLNPSFLKIFLISLSGGLLGVVLMVPFRYFLMFREHKALPFPEGTACFEVLKAGEKKARGAPLVLKGIAIGSVFQVLRSGLNLFTGTVEHAFTRLHHLTLGMELSPIMFGVGFLVGPGIAMIMLGGALLRGMFVTPVLHWLYADTAGAADIGLMIRMIGAGGVAMGGLLSIIKALPLISASFRSVMKGIGVKGRNGHDRTQKDLPGRALALLALAALVLALWSLSGTLKGAETSFFVIIPAAIVMILVFSFFFVAVSSRMVGLIGTTSQPVSGMTICALLATAFILNLLGLSGLPGMACALVAGAVICNAICISGDVSQDLKTGALLGATPYKQQAGEVIACLVAAGVAGLVILVFNRSGDLETLPAPQAHLMADIVKAVMTGNVMWTFIGIGALIALVAFFCGISPLAFAIGLYLPVTTSSALIVGGLVRRVFNKKGETGRAMVEKGTLFSSGLIAGEALFGVILAFVAILKINLAVPGFPAGPGVDAVVSIALYGGIVYYFLRKTR